MAESSRADRKRKRGGDCRIFLSHSGKQKPFVEQLFVDLKRVRQDAFFDQDSDSLPKAERFAPNILEAAEQCEMGVVVLSEDYLTSMWPMLELSKFVESKKTNNPALRLFPIFFKLSPADLKDDQVESRWKPAWRNIVRKDGTEEEVIQSWSEAVRALRAVNGMDYANFANSEYKYRTAIQKEICKELRPIFKWRIDNIQGYERLCEEASSMFKDYETCKYLGLFGMAGVGKSTLCKAMCNYCQAEFGGDVYYVELKNDKADDRLARLKVVLQQMRVDSSILSLIGTEEQGWQNLKDLLGGRPPIFLAIDNVGVSDDSKQEAQSYLRFLPHGSKVLVTSTCKEILEDVIYWNGHIDHPGYAERCKPIPRLNQNEALALFLSKVNAISRLGISSIMERYLRECQFVEEGWDTPQYHPRILRAIGLYYCEARNAGISWEEALENKNKLQRSKEVNESLGKNYRPLSAKMKLVFLDTVLFLSNGYAPLPWWTPAKKIAYNDVWVSWICEVHGTTPSDAKMSLKDLHKLALIKVSTSENFSSAVRVVKNEVIWSGEESFHSKEVQGVQDNCCFERPYAHDLYKVFAKNLVEKEDSMEWEWWMSREELDTPDKIKLKRVILKENKSVIGRAPKMLQSWRSLEFLMLSGCTKFGRDNVLELGGLNKLRALVVDNCVTLKQIICSCNYNYSNQDLACEGLRQHCEGCMAELRSVKLQLLNSLEDISFLRHCPKIHILSIVSCNGTIVPTTSEYSENPRVMNLSHMKELQTLIVWEDLHKVDVDTFSKWLCNTLQLQKLKALEYWVLERPPKVLQRAKKVNWDVEIAGVNTIRLNIGDETSSKLLVLSLCLPKQIWEAQWSRLSSELKKLNLCSCKGSRQWPDLQELRAWVLFSPCQSFMN